MVLATTLCTTARSQQSESQKLQSCIGIEYFTKKPKEGNNLSVDLAHPDFSVAHPSDRLIDTICMGDFSLNGKK